MHKLINSMKLNMCLAESSCRTDHRGRPCFPRIHEASDRLSEIEYQPKQSKFRGKLSLPERGPEGHRRRRWPVRLRQGRIGRAHKPVKEVGPTLTLFFISNVDYFSVGTKDVHALIDRFNQGEDQRLPKRRSAADRLNE